MKTKLFLFIAILSFSFTSKAQKFKGTPTDTTAFDMDTMVTVQLRDVDIYTFKNPDDQMEYYKDRSRIKKILPYLKIAIQLYDDVIVKKDDAKKKEFRLYRKDLEKEMKAKFEKELRDLNVGQGKVLVKLINRETGNNCYGIIKEIKGGFNAWTWQIVAKHYDYNLKEEYSKEKEWILEMAIRSLGPEYDIKKPLRLTE